MKKKYVLNVKSKTYHIIGGCTHSKQYSKNSYEMKEYCTEDEIIAENQNYVHRCKICFRNK